MHLEESNVAFETTQWTLLDALHDADQDTQAAALNTLIHRYWPAVYTAVRSHGQNRELAAETTQAFFAEVVLSRKLFHQGDRDRGRLRSLIRTALKRFVIDQHRRARRHTGLALTDNDLQREDQFVTHNSEVDLETVFDRRWAVSVLETALERCRQYCTSNNLNRHWDAFAMQSVAPVVHGNSRPELNAVARQTGFDSSAEAASATKVVRKRLRLFLREVIAETASDPQEQDAEYNYMIALLS